MDNLKYANQLKKENERAQGKIKLLIKSCKQLEAEKEMLQKELSRLEAAQEKQKTGECELGPSASQTSFPLVTSHTDGVCLGGVFSALFCYCVLIFSSYPFFNF